MSRARGAKAQKRIQTQEKTINFDQARKHQPRHIELVPKTRNQEKLILNLLDPSQHIVVAVGPAGTGKTYLSVLAAIKALKTGQCERIILTRPAVEVDGEKHGFLPGDLNEKMDPWVRPITDILRLYYRQQEIAQMLEEGTIEISPLAYMRGRTFSNAFIIADEMQNSSILQTKMLMTRIGEGSKIVITGDVEQTDHKKGCNGLADLCAKLTSKATIGIALCEFGTKDVQRHHLIESILKMYKDE